MLREQPLRSVRQRFAEAVDSAVVGRDQAVLLRNASGHTQARHARRGRESGCDHFAPRDFVHVRSLGVTTRPVIIARMRLLNPAIQIITMWTSRKSRSARETKR